MRWLTAAKPPASRGRYDEGDYVEFSESGKLVIPTKLEKSPGVPDDGGTRISSLIPIAVPQEEGDNAGTVLKESDSVVSSAEGAAPPPKASRRWLTSDTKYYDVTFPPGTEVFLDASGALVAANLLSAQVIHGIPCATGTEVAFYGDGRLKFATLASPKDIQKTKFPAGALVGFYHVDSGGTLKFAHLSAELKYHQRDTSKEGGSPEVVFPKDTWLVFDALGALMAAKLPSAQEILGIPCAAGTWVRFHERGTIAAATLSSPKDIQGRQLLAGQEVSFYEDGQLRSATLASILVVRDIVFPAETAVYFHRSGAPMFAKLSSPREIRGTSYPAGTWVGFDLDGALIAVGLPPRGVTFFDGRKSLLDESPKGGTPGPGGGLSPPAGPSRVGDGSASSAPPSGHRTSANAVPDFGGLFIAPDVPAVMEGSAVTMFDWEREASDSTTSAPGWGGDVFDISATAGRGEAVDLFAVPNAAPVAPMTTFAP